MLDKLSIISRVVSEHAVFKQHLKLAGDTVGDVEASLALERARLHPEENRLALEEWRQKLIGTLHLLREGLQNHFEYEEKMLLPIIGDFLLVALRTEHSELDRTLANAIMTVSETHLEAAPEGELPDRLARIKEAVFSLRADIESHADKETVLLEMAQEALREPSP